MPIVGYFSNLGRAYSIANAYSLVWLTYRYTAVANDFLDSVSFRAELASGVASADLALYNIIAFSPRYRQHTPITVNIAAGAMTYHSTSFTPIALTAGMTYCIALGGVVAAPKFQGESVPGDQMSAHDSMPLENIWVHDGFTQLRLNFWGNIINVPPPPTVKYPCCAQII